MRAPSQRRHVLLRERHVLAGGPGGAQARLRIQHQRQQAQRLRLLRQQLDQQRPSQIASSARLRRAGSAPVASVQPSAYTA
jgi:hypothetical protein